MLHQDKKEDRRLIAEYVDLDIRRLRVKGKQKALKAAIEDAAKRFGISEKTANLAPKGE
jgi:hypothetical protein